VVASLDTIVAAGVGAAVGVIDRLARTVLADDVPLERRAVMQRVRELLPAEAPLADPGVARDVADAVVGLGPLEELLRDRNVSDVLVNGDGAVWVEREGALRRAGFELHDPAIVVAAVERMIAPLGLRLDMASPAVDARLPDGSRLHAIIPPASVDGPVVAIRRFTEAVADLDELVARGGIGTEGEGVLRGLVIDRSNVIVAGATGSGKTTLLNVLSRAIPTGERIVTVEDAAELQLDGHVVRLEGRPPNTEGIGAITVRQLLRHALRLRPDRIVVGEVRGAEGFDMLQAMSTGHDGSMSTIHASDAAEALWRLETLALSADARVTEASVRRQVGQAIDAVVLVERHGELRRVRSITHVAGSRLEVLYRC
jgi:pilus assembly protein CpaF